MNSSKKRQVSIARLLDRGQQPYYVLDANQAIVACNESLLDWVGHTSQDLLGQVCSFGHQRELTSDDSESPALQPSDIRIQRTTTGLCPPPSGRTQTSQAFIAHIERHDSSLSQRICNSFRLEDGKGQFHTLILVNGSDATDAECEQFLSGNAAEATKLHRLLAQLRHREQASFQIEQLLGESSWAEQLRQQMKVAVKTRPRLLIVGPEGSGREQLAKSIHFASGKSPAGPLVPLDCRILDAELMQTTIVRVRKRLAQQDASQSACFLLQEVDRLTADAQHELVGLLQLPEFELHTIATSSSNPAALMERDDFDSDLLRRMTSITMELPPLYERREDIPLMVQSLIENENLNGASQIEGCSDRAMDRLVSYAWPGNLSELKETIKTACANSEGPFLESKDLPKRIEYAESADRLTTPRPEPIDLDAILSNVEDELIRRALTQADGNKTKAAEMLGISRARLHRKLESDESTA